MAFSCVSVVAWYLKDEHIRLLVITEGPLKVPVTIVLIFNSEQLHSADQSQAKVNRSFSYPIHFSIALMVSKWSDNS